MESKNDNNSLNQEGIDNAMEPNQKLTGTKLTKSFKAKKHYGVSFKKERARKNRTANKSRSINRKKR